MFYRILFTMLVGLSIVSDALADLKRVAVLEFRGPGVESPILLKLSDQSRVAASEVLSKDEYLIMTRDNMMQVLNDMGKDASCIEGQCEVEIGRNIQADFIMTGDLLKVEGTYFLTLKLYDTLSGGLLVAKDIEADTFKELLHQTKDGSNQMFREGLGIEASTFSVSVRTEPSGAMVFIDGSLECRSTPCNIVVEEGEHRVQIEQSGFEKIEKSITVSKNLVLQETLKAEPGYLSLTTSPNDLTVSLGQRKIGTSPIVKYPVSSGLHSISVAHDCYEDSTFSVQVPSGQTVSRHVSLTPLYVPIEIVLSEASAVGDVYIDGQSVGTTPYRGRTQKCSRKAVVKVGSDRYTKSLHLQNGSNYIQIAVPSVVAQSNYIDPKSGTYEADWFVASGYSDTMIVSTGTRYEPMFDMTGSHPTGIDVEIARELARRLGKSDVRFVRSSSARLTAKNEEADFAIAAISITDKRKSIHLFSEPYFETGQVVVMRDVGQYSYGTLSSKKCGYHSPLYKSILKKHGCTIQKYSSSTAVMNALRAGSIDYTILEEQSVPDEFWKSSIISRDSYGIVFPNNAYDLKYEVDKHLRDMENSGFIDQLKYKYNVH